MLSRGLTKTRRIPLLRPLRPPNRWDPPHPRLFTQNTQLLLISKHSPRPQLPYLSQPSSPSFARQHPFLQGQIARLLSTETRQRFVAQVWLTAKWTLIIFVFFSLGGIAWEGIKLEKAERANPTPREWRYWTRQALRNARGEQNAVKEGTRMMVDWARVGGQMRECLRRLEDAQLDGKGLDAVGGGGDAEQILIPHVGRAGHDVSAKSYEWRTGYFEVVMGCAVAAEHLDGMVVDRTRGHVFPADMMLGPSNPDPRPVPAFMSQGVAPREQDCEPVFAPPETYYMRVLTGHGFTTSQKLQAVEGFANWLEFKGLPSSAEEMYRWGVDIAKDALPTPPEVVADAKNDVLTEQAAKHATPNLLRATTDLAIHHARTGNISAALPIFLSVLRARSNAPVSDFLAAYDHDLDEDGSLKPKTDIGQAIDWIKGIFKPPRFPSPPPSGDEPLTRPTDRPTCEEGELMLYIGEIVFANEGAEKGSEGVAWTRSAVRIAESNIEALRKRLIASRSGRDLTPAQQEERKKCKGCLIAGVQNWETMLRQLSTQQVSTAEREGGRNAGWLEWRGWFGGGAGGGGVKGAVLDEAAVGVVEEELRQVEILRERVVREAREEEMQGEGPRLGATWIG